MSKRPSLTSVMSVRTRPAPAVLIIMTFWPPTAYRIIMSGRPLVTVRLRMILWPSNACFVVVVRRPADASLRSMSYRPIPAFTSAMIWRPADARLLSMIPSYTYVIQMGFRPPKFPSAKPHYVIGRPGLAYWLSVSPTITKYRRMSGWSPVCLFPETSSLVFAIAQRNFFWSITTEKHDTPDNKNH